MKKIVMLTMLQVWSMDSNRGAPSFYNTLKGYNDKGWQIILITPHREKKIKQELKNLKIVNFKPLFKNIPSIPKIAHLLRLINIKYSELVMYHKARVYLKKEHNDFIIYSYEVHGVKAAKRLSDKLKLPLITRFQGTVLGPINNNMKNRILYYPHFQALSTRSDIIIMTDDGTKGDKVLNKLNNKSENIFFWRNGVNLDFLNKRVDSQEINLLKSKYNINKNDKVLLTVSRLELWKRVDRAIVALSKLQDDYSNVKLIIVGEGSERNNLEQLTHELNIDSNVVFAGAVCHNEVKNFMAITDIFLSLYDLSNVGNPLLESMAMGNPIITLNVGDTSKVILNEKNGLLVNIEEIDKIPKKIQNLLDNSLYAKNLGQNAKKYAKDNFWTWNERFNFEEKYVNELCKSIN